MEVFEYYYSILLIHRESSYLISLSLEMNSTCILFYSNIL